MCLFDLHVSECLLAPTKNALDLLETRMTLPIQLIAISYGRGASLITRLSIQNIISDFVAAVTVI